MYRALEQFEIYYSPFSFFGVYFLFHWRLTEPRTVTDIKGISRNVNKTFVQSPDNINNEITDKGSDGKEHVVKRMYEIQMIEIL